MPFEEDTKLVRNCLAGDTKAWDSLLKKYSNLIYKTILDTLKKYSSFGRIDANDVYQDVFMKIHEKLDQWTGDASLGTWIRAIAHNTTVDELRELKFVPLEKDERTDNPDPIPRIFLDELSKYLTPMEILLVKIFFIEEWPPEEIVQFLKKDIGPVYVMKNRLLNKLRTICQKNRLL